MKMLLMVSLVLTTGITLLTLPKIERIIHEAESKMRGDVRAANAQERIALALERAYPAPVAGDLKDAVAEPPMRVLPLPGYNH